MEKTLLTAALWVGMSCVAAFAEGTPKLQFDQTVYDFGKTSQVASVSGVFKFKNAGDGVLKLEPPKPTCGCTVAALKPDTLAPGASGELSFTFNLGFYRATLEKHIMVRSNDPQTPEVTLTIKADYTPLYEINPMILSPRLAFGVNDTNQFATIARTDGKPLNITRLEATKPWIKATVEPAGDKPEDSKARICVSVQRDGSPRRFTETVVVYGADHTNGPISNLFVYGQFEGEISFSPEALYWSVPSATNNPAAQRPEAQALRRVTIRSADGRTVELKNAQSTVKDVKVELVQKEPGKVFELVALLQDTPASTVSGNVSFETSVAEQPKIVIPVIVNVFKP